MPTPESKTLKFWPVPVKGIWRHVPSYQIPDDALYDSLNVVERDGVLIVRPGHSEFSSDNLQGASAIGATMYYKTAATPVIVLMTNTKTYSYAAGVWTDRTSTDWTGGFMSQGRFASIVLGNTTPTSYVIMTNGVDPPKKWDGTAATTSLVAGTPATWTDVTTISDRIVGIKPPYNVNWSPVRQIDSWPALNYHQAAFTPDEVVAIRNLGVQGGVLYKRRSIWTVSPTGLDSDTKAYRFDLYGLFDGPANPNALVDADGLHVRMTATGRIGVFDGSKHAWIGDGVWPLIKDNMAFEESGRVFGVYDPINLVVTMYYPTGGSHIHGMVMITLPTVGRPEFGCFLGELEADFEAGFGDGPTAGVTYTQPPGEDTPYIPLIFAGNSDEIHPYALEDGTSGNENAITGFWQTGLFKLPESHRVEALELYASRVAGVNLAVQPVTSWLLADDGTLGQARNISLNRESDLPRDPIGVDQRARFVGLRFSFDENAGTPNLEYKGVSLLGQKVTI